MTRIPIRAIPIVAASATAIILSACVAGSGSWYDRHCQQKGYTPGTAAFDQCKADARKWIERTQNDIGGLRPGGPL